jgi:hypothetical protein
VKENEKKRVSPGKLEKKAVKKAKKEKAPKKEETSKREETNKRKKEIKKDESQTDLRQFFKAAVNKT